MSHPIQRRFSRRAPRTRSVIAATGVLVICIAPFAAARTGENLREGVRNGTTLSETEIISNIASTLSTTGGYSTRQSNLSSSGGGAIYGCRSAAGGSAAKPRPQNPCVRANNLSTGYAFEFNASKGAVGGLISVGSGGEKTRPFVTNATGVALGLNADRVDGLHASQIVAAARTKTGLAAEDADKLGGTSAATIKDETQPWSFKLTNGQSKTIVTVGPLTLSAGCAIGSGGNDIATYSLKTTADNSVARYGATDDADFDASETHAVNSTVAADTVSWTSTGPIQATAPDGSNLLTTGDTYAGLNVHGTGDSCYFSGAAVVSGTT